MATEKNVEDMTLEEAWRVLEERAICGSCHECFAGSSYWESSCGEVSKHAFYMVRDTFNAVESSWKESVMTDKQKEAEHSSTEPFYQQTVGFMKSSGYTHCYMCGSKLE